MGKPATEKVDAYSFAICTWELLARTMLLFMRKKRVAHYVTEYTPKLWATDAAAGTRAELSPKWPPQLCAIMTACWHADPAQRPGFKAVMDELHDMLEPQRFTDPHKPKAPDGGCCALQ
jgi:hypothetical protein